MARHKQHQVRQQVPPHVRGVDVAGNENHAANTQRGFLRVQLAGGQHQPGVFVKLRTAGPFMGLGRSMADSWCQNRALGRGVQLCAHCTPSP